MTRWKTENRIHMCLVLLEQWMNKGNIRRLMSDYALFVEIIF